MSAHVMSNALRCTPCCLILGQPLKAAPVAYAHILYSDTLTHTHFPTINEKGKNGEGKKTSSKHQQLR